MPAVALAPRLSLPPVWPWLARLRTRLGLVLAAPIDGRQDEVDDLVLARARRGDHLAFTEIVRCYDGRLRALAFRLLDDRHRMDDVLQEAYVKAYRGLPGFKGTSALGTWLYRITYNATISPLSLPPTTTPPLPSAAAGPTGARPSLPWLLRSPKSSPPRPRRRLDARSTAGPDHILQHPSVQRRPKPSTSARPVSSATSESADVATATSSADA